VKVFGQQMNVTNFVHKKWDYSKDEYCVRWVLFNFTFSFTVKFPTIVFCIPYIISIH
jgi:hypothetical protein